MPQYCNVANVSLENSTNILEITILNENVQVGVIVQEVIEAIKNYELKVFQELLLLKISTTGLISQMVLVAVAYELYSLYYQNVAMYNSETEKYTVVISRAGKHPVGTLLDPV